MSEEKEMFKLPNNQEWYDKLDKIEGDHDITAGPDVELDFECLLDYPVCPVCGFEYEEAEDYGDYVTYWGKPHESECLGCGAKLDVTESVTRTWDVKVKEQDNGQKTTEVFPGHNKE